MTKIYNSPLFYNSFYRFPGEEWMEVEGYPNYNISNMGRVYSKKRATVARGHILRLTPNKQGYQTVMLFNESGPLRKPTHRLVAIHWIKNPIAKREVNHINGIKRDNHFANLEWATRQENATHAAHMNAYKTKLNPKDIPYIRTMVKEGATLISLGKEFSVHPATIGKIIRHKTWRHIK